MKHKIYREVYQGNGAMHLLSIVENNCKDMEKFNVRESKLLKTKVLILDPLYKSPI